MIYIYNDMNPVITYYEYDRLYFLYDQLNKNRLYTGIYWFTKSSVFLVFFLGPSLPPKRIWGRLEASYI